MDVRMPDGTIVKNVPEGITQEDLTERYGQFKAAAPKEAAPKDPSLEAANQYGSTGWSGKSVEEMGALERGVGSAKHAFDRAAMGLKGLFTDLTPEDKALLEQGKQFTKNAGTAGTVGEFAGDMALTAAPMVRGVQAAKAAGRFLPQAMSRIPGAGLAPAAAAGAATGAAFSPEDRGSAALAGGVGGAGGELAGRALSRVLPGLSRNRDIPFWKEGDGGLLDRAKRRMFEAGKALPITGQVIKGGERTGYETFAREMSARASPPVPVRNANGDITGWRQTRVTDTGPEAVSKLADNFDEAYGALYRGREVPLDKNFRFEIEQNAAQGKTFSPRQSGEIDGAIAQINHFLEPPGKKWGGGPQVESVNQAIRAMDSRIKSAYQRGDGELAETLKAFKDSLQGLRARGIGAGDKAVLDEVNKAYTTFLQLQQAYSTQGAQAAGMVTPRQMMSGIKAKGNKNQFSRGELPNQAEVNRWQQSLGNELPSTGPGTAEKVVGLGEFGTALTGNFAPLATDASIAAIVAAMNRVPKSQKVADRTAQLLRTYGVQSTLD